MHQSPSIAVWVVGLAMFLWRRMNDRSQRILRRAWVSAMAWLLLAIGVTGFLLEGARIAEDLPGFEKWSVVGYGLALGMRAVGIHGEAALGWHRAMWIIHAVLCVVFFALLAQGFFSHAAYGAASWMTRTRRRRSELRPLPPSLATEPNAWSSLLRHDLLQADTCTTCGRCNEVCPATAAGKPLRPREVVLGLRRAMDEDAAPSSFIADDVLWSWTTCAACNEACPVGIEVFDKIVDLRRAKVERGQVPAAAETLFESSAASFNPFEKPNTERAAWAAGLEAPVAAEGEAIELLYWVGCAGSFDPQGKGVARAMVRILNHLGVNYRILGNRERCTGDPARRMGEEGLFRELANMNIAALRGHGVARVLNHCPHCFNTFRNEYPQLGARFEVEHDSQFLARMIAQGRLAAPALADATVTFHDPCYLGRGNDETQAPRNVLMSLPQLKVVEMPRHGRESFCCGAGGGSMWLDVPGAMRVENLRAAEAADTGATVVATACPFCKGMLEAGAQSLNGAPMQVRDLAELVAEAHGL